MRSPWPHVRQAVYCTECRQTVRMLLVERDGKHFYVCVGNKSSGYPGCGFYHDHGRIEKVKENDNG